ncbi:MAG TPA: zf-HC2 domain-containing protein [Anaeromyxobacteraceae bacterium]|nr:zf-HC2 domain-containing protein [Anaeromyxobacteraceae bacterium]
MLTCKQITEMATDRADGALDAVARLAFDEHLRACDGCRAYVRQLEVTREALRRLPETEVSPAFSDALLATFDAWTATQGGRFSPWPAVGVLGMLVLLVAFARQRSQAPEDWVIAAALAGAALAVASLAGRLAMGIVVAAVAAALVGALAGGSAGALDFAAGVECFALELVSAVVVAGVAWLGVRGRSRVGARTALAMGGLAGALAADAALQMTCKAHGALLHLVVFHLGGVLLVAVGAAAVVRSARLAARP